jgi:predicted acyltransferase
MYGAGKLWGLQMPVNKYIWTSTMTLVTSGLSFIFLVVIYYVVDGLKWKGLDWLLPFGLNAIFIYFIGFICDFHSVTDHLTRGLKQYVADPHWFGLIRHTVHGLLVYGLLYLMMKKKVFLRV